MKTLPEQWKADQQREPTNALARLNFASELIVSHHCILIGFLLLESLIQPVQLLLLTSELESKIGQGIARRHI